MAGRMFVELNGTPYENGKAAGAFAKNVLAGRVGQARRIQKNKRIPGKILSARAKEWTKLVLAVAPHWLEEIKGVSDGSGVASEDLVMLNCLPPDFYPDASLEKSCTSFVSVGPDVNRLLKIRDQRNFPQSFSIIRNRGFALMQAGRDIGDAGFAHFLSGTGLAGANNTGSPSKNSTDKPLLNDRHVLRFIAENASSTGDIPALAEKLLEKRMTCGAAGAGRGAIYLFADRDRGLLIECDTINFRKRIVSKGTLAVSNHFITPGMKKWESEPPGRNTLIRKARMETLLDRAGTDPSPQEIFSITRDRKHRPACLCNDDIQHYWMTISVQYQVIDRKNPEKTVNHVCCGNPRHSVFVPVPATFKKTFVPMLGGGFYKMTDRAYRKHRCGKNSSGRVKRFEALSPGSGDAELVFRQAYELVKNQQG